MQAILRSFLVGAIVAVGGAAMAAVAAAPDPILGTWTLNLAKSKFTPGRALKSQTRTYTQTADGIELTVTGVAADGSPMSQKSTFQTDGKEHAFTGSPDFDSLSMKRINGTTVRTTLKKAGKVAGTTMRSVSGHGKVLTLRTKGTDASGEPYEDLQVYDKQ